jgi:hypothetical protein
MPKPAIKYHKIGTNIRYRQLGNSLILKIDLTAETKESSSGRAMIVADTNNRFETLAEIEGEFGLRMILSQRKQFKKKPDKKPVKEAKPKRRGKRDDDED